jgi:hypothetical protein
MLLLALCVLGWCPCPCPPTGAGVSGGVIHDAGIPLGTGPECVAATDGTACSVGVWCMSTALDPLVTCAVGVAASDVGPEPPETVDASDSGSAAGAAKVPEMGSPEAVAPGTAKGPTDDEALMLRAGLAGRAGPKAETMDCWRGRLGAIGVTGVAFGVVCCETTVFRVEMRMLCCSAVLPSYTMPSSPGEKARHEQNPSDEAIRRVSPSLDLSS